MQIRTQRSTLIHSGFLFILFFNYFSCSVCHLLIKDGCTKLTVLHNGNFFCAILIIKKGGKQYKSIAPLYTKDHQMFHCTDGYKLATFGTKSLSLFFFFFFPTGYLFWVIFSIMNNRTKKIHFLPHLLLFLFFYLKQCKTIMIKDVSTYRAIMS